MLEYAPLFIPLALPAILLLDNFGRSQFFKRWEWTIAVIAFASIAVAGIVGGTVLAMESPFGLGIIFGAIVFAYPFAICVQGAYEFEWTKDGREYTNRRILRGDNP